MIFFLTVLFCNGLFHGMTYLITSSPRILRSLQACRHLAFQVTLYETQRYEHTTQLLNILSNDGDGEEEPRIRSNLSEELGQHITTPLVWGLFENA